MLVLVIVLLATNLVTLGLLAWLLLRPAESPGAADPLAAAVDAAPRPSAAAGARRLITIEILNPIELAGTRGRIVGIAGSLAPGITRRIVYEQAVKLVKRQLAAERVVADVRVHTLRPAPPRSRRRPTPPTRLPDDVGTTAPAVIDSIVPVDLSKRDDPQRPV